MNLHVLPTRTAGAAENMATDFLLLQRYPGDDARFRHYGWRTAAFTFGYAQRFAFVQSQLPPDATLDVCRRPTGGGIVDHRDDWTYALVVPRGHPMEERRASESYRAVHEAVAEALQRQGVPAVTKPCVDTCGAEASGAETVGPAGVCFQRAEVFDVIHRDSGAKIAGAAQKRNKHGLLFQGSIWRPAAGSAVDWDRFETDFVERLAIALQVEPAEVPWPEWNEDELDALREQYSSPEWQSFR